jgi:DNA-binding transcriptional regulator YdaS (Cro superfamily)
MTLADYLRLHNKTATEFAAELAVDKSTVSRWLSGESRPRWADVPAIVRVTGGAVTANDFMPAGPADGAADVRAAPAAVAAE